MRNRKRQREWTRWNNVAAAARQPEICNEHRGSPRRNAKFLFLFCSECEITNPDSGALGFKVVIYFSWGRKILGATVSVLTGPSITWSFQRNEDRRDDGACLDTDSTNHSLFHHFNKTTYDKDQLGGDLGAG
ncbi:hypothetical protein C0J50_14380 [Silurus asotus]|uniref:Uncharacterized protein n=1 Tax=Silurus asotus TaxID=30991 RepID=A0AAD5AZX5_SILAS|nr:hypothetical protein C0J50_14380 [Silurus asotus]